MRRKLLSICVPSYKGEFYIGEVLQSIVEQRLKGIEVVISDDSPDDRTGDAVKEYQDSNTKILYQKNKKTLGFDRNLLKVVSLASGEYCWLLGQDDKLLPGSLEKIFQITKRNEGLSLIHCNYTRYDNNLKKITASKMISLDEDKKFDEAGNFLFKHTKNSYFDYLGTNIITMSTDIVNKRLWEKASKTVDDYLGHNFIHCFVIAKMIKDNPNIFYIGKPQVWYRSKNERVWPNDVWKDYNEVFINYLVSLGYDKDKALEARRQQRKFEKREALMKNRALKYLYPFASPLLGIYRMLRSRLSSR